MIPKLGLTRTVVRRNYALIARDSYVPSILPGWTKCVSYVLLSGGMGAGLSQYVLELEEGGQGQRPADDEEYFLYLMAGAGTLNGALLSAGGFGFVPAETALEFTSLAAGTRLLVFQKTYEALEGAEAPAFLTGQEAQIGDVPFLGDERARLKTLLPDHLGMDLAVNIFTYQPGATLPFVETHIMEHGMLFLRGSGVYRLDEDWWPVTAGDAIWIAPYCPQWFIAAGPEPACYIYYKDVNRSPW